MREYGRISYSVKVRTVSQKNKNKRKTFEKPENNR